MIPKIPFNKPYLTGNEFKYLEKVKAISQFSGNGVFAEKCTNWLELVTGCKKALMTHSCTGALEMTALLIDIKPGDEIIMPSFTFVSTANAFAKLGGVPVFVDIRPDTLNIDESLIEEAITAKTKAIVVVHYAGVACEMDKICYIAKNNKLILIEDAAQAVLSTYKNNQLGTIGDLGCYSFHQTKNIFSGEGGALLVNNPEYVEKAEIIFEKGTNRKKFLNGDVDKYSWVDLGSSFLQSELTSAFLWAQLEKSKEITSLRQEIWCQYKRSLKKLEHYNIQLPVVPKECVHNGHIFFILLKNFKERTSFLEKMKERNIHCSFHYTPLHSTPFGREKSRCFGKLKNTDSIAERIVRLPIWIGLKPFLGRITRQIITFWEN